MLKVPFTATSLLLLWRLLLGRLRLRRLLLRRLLLQRMPTRRSLLLQRAPTRRRSVLNQTLSLVLRLRLHRLFLLCLFFLLRLWFQVPGLPPRPVVKEVLVSLERLLSRHFCLAELLSPLPLRRLPGNLTSAPL